MESLDKASALFPIHQVIFILTVGLFIVISFPFDYNELLNFTKVTFTDEFGLLPMPNGISLTDNFQPFVNLQYLGNNAIDFSSGVLQMVLLSLPIGALIYSISKVYEVFNRAFTTCVCFIIGKKPKTKGINLDDHGVDNLSFNIWVGRRHLGRHINFLASIREVNTGLLYGAQTLLLFVLIPAIIYHNSYFIGWLIISLTLCTFFGVTYLLSEYKFKKENESLVDCYKEEYFRSLHCF
mgnify:CR=1 FL=1